MTEATKLALMHVLKISVPNYAEAWVIAESSDDEDNHMHLFAYQIPTAFDLLNSLGGLGVQFNVAYIEGDSNSEPIVVSINEPIEIEIQSIPNDVLRFKALG